MAWLRPVVVATAGDFSVTISVYDRLPPPEPAIADSKDDGRNAQRPDKEVESYVPAGMYRLAEAAKEKEEGDGIVD